LRAHWRKSTGRSWLGLQQLNEVFTSTRLYTRRPNVTNRDEQYRQKEQVLIPDANGLDCKPDI
jgi:hypothetical protein